MIADPDQIEGNIALLAAFHEVSRLRGQV